MRLILTWPDTRAAIGLNDTLTRENAVSFDVVRGVFGSHQPAQDGYAMVFYWKASGPVLVNLCQKHVCLLDGADVEYGAIHPLRIGQKLQCGHFKIGVVVDHTNLTDDVWQRDWLLSQETATDNIPRVEDILPNGGHYLTDLRYFNDVTAAQNNSDDVLKTLEVEYKRFLIWHEQGRGGFSNNIHDQENRFSVGDERFDRDREQSKSKTLTECIIDTPFLIERVWEELDMENSTSEILDEEEKIDILKSLAPDDVAMKEKKSVPELVFRDFYKVGLDSHY